MSNTLDFKEQTRSKTSSDKTIDTEPLSFDEIIDRAIRACDGLPLLCKTYIANIKELKHRLAQGRLHLAVLGQFNRGKSTFINALIGMKILPSSVLPLTSVPTLISWGEHVRCVIRFWNGKPDLVVQKSLEAITSTLAMYVAEESNPVNQLCVREAVVNCPSPLLENGTVLIDTPGFGSTYVHNTHTALQTLVECDAAIFLISTDPPLTQMEVEFLKQVKTKVPRIFFILNKIDLVSPGELSQVDRFIREALVVHMGYATGLRLFHICALNGLNASRQEVTDAVWKESGMETVKSGILDFMIREKYFTLSQALTGKLKDALNSVCTILTREIDEYQKPVDTLQMELSEFVNTADSVRKTVDKELALVDIEKKAVLKYLDDQVVQVTKTVEMTLNSILDSLLSNKQDAVKSIDNLVTALNKVLHQALLASFVVLINRINKPLRKAIQVHLREFSNVNQMVLSSIGDHPQNSASVLQEKLEPLEIDIDISWSFPFSVSEKNIVTEWAGWFQNRQTRLARIRNYLENLSKDMIAGNMKTASSDLKDRLSSSFEKMREILKEMHSCSINSLDKVASKKKTSFTERKNDAETPVRKLKEQIQSIHSVMQLLK